MPRPRCRIFRVAFVLFGIGMLAASVPACDGTLIAALDCPRIPEGGCPESGATRNGCDDGACSALYECRALNATGREGSWSFVRECPARPARLDAGLGDAATDAADGAARDAAAVPADLPPGATGGPGCIDLELPDCALGVGYGCSSACCGCEELFVCVDGGWDSWGFCQNDAPTPY